MRPLAALLAILTGSAVALASGLLLTWVVILFLPAGVLLILFGAHLATGPARAQRR